MKIYHKIKLEKLTDVETGLPISKTRMLQFAQKSEEQLLRDENTLAVRSEVVGEELYFFVTKKASLFTWLQWVVISAFGTRTMELHI